MSFKMEKSLSDLISSHIDIFDENGVMSGSSRRQVDFLRFYVPSDKIALYGTPFTWLAVRDNPNYVPTDYENVYMLTDYKSCIWDYCLPGVAPVSVLRWSYVKVKKDGVYQDLLEVCIYGKALALYYAGHLSRLDSFVMKFGGECSRVDLCWDFKHKIPGKDYQLDIYTDLKRSAEYLNGDADDFDTIYYGKRHSPFMIRVYNKTADLRKDKNIHAFIYPSWYMKECRRLEIELKGRYSRMASPIEWLTSKKRDFTIKPLDQSKRNNYKTLIYSAVNCIDCINYSEGEKILILQNAKSLIDQKLKNLIK